MKLVDIIKEIKVKPDLKLNWGDKNFYQGEYNGGLKKEVYWNPGMRIKFINLGKYICIVRPELDLADIQKIVIIPKNVLDNISRFKSSISFGFGRIKKADMFKTYYNLYKQGKYEVWQ